MHWHRRMKSCSCTRRSVLGLAAAALVATRAKAKTGGKKAQTDLYFNEYMGSPKKLLLRFKVPNAEFYNDSVIASFKVEANPDPNPDKTAGIALSWYKHLGDQGDETKYYGVTSHGIDVY